MTVLVPRIALVDPRLRYVTTFGAGHEVGPDALRAHRTRDSIEAQLTVVFAALAVSRWIENITGWSIKKFVKTARRYRSIQIQVGAHTITAADPLPADLRDVLETICASRPAH